jgi:hypothetical protein
MRQVSDPICKGVTRTSLSPARSDYGHEDHGRRSRVPPPESIVPTSWPQLSDRILLIDAEIFRFRTVVVIGIGRGQERTMIMETASSFAKKHGLERYLEKPAELNEMILKLMVLQEAMQGERSGKIQDNPAGSGIIAVRRAATGKFTARCSGDLTYRYAVETALKGSTATVALFQQGRFTALLRQMGVPEERIAEFCFGITIDDDTHCWDQE